MKYFVLHIVLLFGFNQVIAQESVSVDETEYVLPFESLKTKDKLRYQFSTGANFSFANEYGSSMTMYYSPNVSYLISPKLIVGAGMTYVNSSLDNFSTIHDLRYQPFTGNISQYYTHVKAKYKINDRLIIGGGIFLNMTELSSSSNQLNKTNFSKIGYSGSFEYRVNDKMTIEGQIRINDSNRNGLGFNSFDDFRMSSGGFIRQNSFTDFPSGR